MSTPKRILAVDDESRDISLLRAILDSEGYEIVSAASGFEALDKLDSSIDLVLLDIMMPGMDGFEVICRIRDGNDCRDVPIIVVTVLDNRDHRIRAIESGANDFISKPIDRIELIVRISAQMKIREAQDALRQSERKYRALVETARDVIWTLNMKLEYTFVSPSITPELGYSPEELIGTCALDLMTPQSREEAVKGLQDELMLEASGPRENFTSRTREIEVFHKDGSIRCREVTMTFIRDDLARPMGILGISHDITDRKRMEDDLRDVRDHLELRVKERTSALKTMNEELLREIAERKRVEQEIREREETLRGILTASPVGIGLNIDGRMRWVNQAWSNIFGFDSEHDWLDQPTRILYPSEEVYEETRNRVYARLQKDEIGEAETVMKRKDGSLFDANLRVCKANQSDPTQGTISVISDISSRKRAAEALRKSERTLRSLVDGNPESLLMIDTEGIVLDANEEVARRFGTTVSGLIGSSVYDLLPPDVVEERKEHVQEVIRTGNPVRFEDTRFGRTIDIHIQPIFDEQGTVVRLALLGIDITNLRKAEEAQRSLAIAIEQAPIVVMIKDALGCIQYVNPAFEQITGYSREEVMGKVPRFLEDEGEDQSAYKELWDTMSRGELYQGRQRFRKKDGTPFIIDLTISPVFDASGKIMNYIRVGQDVTDRVQLEQQLFQAQKMEAIGTLAGGIAHDFNNLLTVVIGFSELLLIDMDEQYPSYADLQKINGAAQRGADLVQRLLAFSRKAEINPRPCNLNDQIEQLQKMLTRTIPKMIEIELNLADGLYRVNGDPTQMDQVLMNLAVNARDAMPDGGKLTMETVNVFLDEEHSRIHLGVKSGQYVRLSVSDTGHGMDKETMDHIFEPFYTTKEVGKGTGLGLAMVYGIVHQHGGHVRCYSVLGHGTTFRIYLPALVAGKDQMEAAAREALLRGGKETILLVDDEELVREVGKRILERSGYTVLTAVNGKDALDLYKRERIRIALVILDLIMPKMGGKQCLEELLKIDPKARVLIASGFAANGRTREALETGARAFVGKPFNVKRMLQSVREVLDSE